MKLRGEQLADPAVRDTHHPDFVVEHPGLVRDRFDDVVSIEVLQRLEEVECSARAAHPAHADVDDGEAHEIRQDGDAAFRSGRIGVRVARVLDERRIRRKEVGPVRERGIGRQAGFARGAGGRVHGQGKLRPIAGGEVLVTAGRDGLAVDARIPRRRRSVVHDERRRLHPIGTPPDAVPGALRDVTEQQPTERVGLLRVEGLPPRGDERHLLVRREARDVYLVDAAGGFEWWGRRRSTRERADEDQEDGRRPASAHQHRALSLFSAVGHLTLPSELGLPSLLAGRGKGSLKPPELLPGWFDGRAVNSCGGRPGMGVDHLGLLQTALCGCSGKKEAQEPAIPARAARPARHTEVHRNG